jgi:hypothetical protein
MGNTYRVAPAARVVALIGSSLIALALLASPVHAGSSDHVECTGVVTGVDVDSVTVPPGEICQLDNSTVSGNVTAERDSTLFAVTNTIGGNLVGDGHDTLQATNNFIGGNVRLQNGTGAGGSGADHVLCDNFINGNVSLQRNNGAIFIGYCGGNFIGGNVSVTDNLTDAPDRFRVRGNRVGGQMQINDNAGDTLKSVQDNVVNRTLSCFDNEDPFIGTPNDAGRAEGQCAP